MLSLTRLFLYSLSCFSSDAVCVWFSLSCFSIHAKSLVASGSCGPIVSRGVCASKYLLISLPCFASLTAALSASTPRNCEQVPMRSKRSSLVRPEEGIRIIQESSEGLTGRHLCNSGCRTPGRIWGELRRQLESCMGGNLWHAPVTTMLFFRLCVGELGGFCGAAIMNPDFVVVVDVKMEILWGKIA